VTASKPVEGRQDRTGFAVLTAGVPDSRRAWGAPGVGDGAARARRPLGISGGASSLAQSLAPSGVIIPRDQPFQPLLWTGTHPSTEGVDASSWGAEGSTVFSGWMPAMVCGVWLAGPSQ
jgi:hypothetical protein